MNKMFLKLKYDIETPQNAYHYCMVHGRISDLEELIIQDPQYAHFYARDVIKGRWVEAEKIIIQDPQWAYYYTYDVIKGRWMEAELIIQKSKRWAPRYKRYLNLTT